MKPNARAKGRGRTKLGETGQSVTPRPLECRVGRRTRKEWPLLFAFRSWLLTIRRNTRNAAIATFGPANLGFLHAVYDPDYVYQPTCNLVVFGVLEDRPPFHLSCSDTEQRKRPGFAKLQR